MDFIEKLQKAAKAVYLATDEDVANDLSGLLSSAAKELAYLRVENQRRGNLLSDVVSEVAHTEKSFYVNNANGTPQYLEPLPVEMVVRALELKDLEINALRAGLKPIV